MQLTAKSRGPGAPMLASSFRGASSTEVTVAKEPGHRGEHEVSRKPPRRESWGCSGSPVVLPPCFFVARGPWVQSAPGFPCALTIVRAAKFMQGSGTSCREDAGVHPHRCLTCESGVSTRHCEERKRRSNPWHSKPRDGLLRFARNDEERDATLTTNVTTDSNFKQHIRCRRPAGP